jgi:hypothetical protein
MREFALAVYLEAWGSDVGGVEEDDEGLGGSCPVAYRRPDGAMGKL